jgi:hypothetical protein
VATEFRFLPSDEDIGAGLTERWVEASGGPVLDDNGDIVMLSGGSIQSFNIVPAEFGSRSPTGHHSAKTAPHESDSES